MSTCKDCIHFDVCYHREHYGADLGDYSICNTFKDKSKVIELPCKVGDKVYLLLEKITGEYVVVESICKEMHDKGFGKTYFMHIDCPEIGNTLEFYLEDFGRTVFLAKEEAQKALGGVEG